MSWLICLGDGSSSGGSTECTSGLSSLMTFAILIALRSFAFSLSGSLSSSSVTFVSSFLS